MYNECRHILPSGNKCHSPALRSQPYCYYHQNLHRYGDPANPQKLTVFPIEDIRGIQIALSQVLASLNSPYMDTRRAGLLLYGLQIAAQLVKQAHALEPAETVRTFEESTGVDLAPEKTVCEPPLDCQNCPKHRACEVEEAHLPFDEESLFSKEEPQDDQDIEKDQLEEGRESAGSPNANEKRSEDEDENATFRRREDAAMLKGALRLFRNGNARTSPAKKDHRARANSA